MLLYFLCLSREKEQFWEWRMNGNDSALENAKSLSWFSRPLVSVRKACTRLQLKFERLLLFYYILLFINQESLRFEWLVKTFVSCKMTRNLFHFKFSKLFKYYSTLYAQDFFPLEKIIFVATQDCTEFGELLRNGWRDPSMDSWIWVVRIRKLHFYKTCMISALLDACKAELK